MGRHLLGRLETHFHSLYRFLLPTCPALLGRDVTPAARLTVLFCSFKKRSDGSQVALVSQKQRLDLPLPQQDPA